MKILHTSDWHLGRRWKGQYRYDELKSVLDNLIETIGDEEVDLILHSGDLFDTRNPPAQAEDLAYEFFVRAHAVGARSVVIAGNHDNPGSFDAQNRLTRMADVHLVGRPRSASNGGVLTIETRSGEVAVIAALPFASPGQFVSGMDLVADDSQARVRYAHMFQAAVNNLAAAFRPDAVNLFMAHTHLDGAVLAQSERRVHVGEQWAGTRQDLPAQATYIALGHIHKPQKIEGLLHAYYAGSPLQLDFGEAGEEKSYILVTAQPGQPPQVEHRPYVGGQSLIHWEGTWPEFESAAESLSNSGWVRVQLSLDEKDPEINRKVRELVPNAITVLPPKVPQPEVDEDIRPQTGASLIEFYRAYRVGAHGEPPDEELDSAFNDLHETALRGENE